MYSECFKSNLSKFWESVGAEIVDIWVIFNKIDYDGFRELKSIGFGTKYLLDVKLNGDKVDIENN